jgi:hypothetical protein
MDASCVNRPGSKGTDRRLHLSFDLGSLTIDSIQFTDSSGGETFSRYPVCAGDICLGDRGYAHRRGVWSIVRRGADALMRINWQNFPLVGTGGKRFDILAHAKRLGTTQVGDWAVRTAASGDAPSMDGRVVALRRSPAAAEQERRRIRREARKKHRMPDQRSLEAAGYIFLFTTLGYDVASASDILQLYRFRWQIELVFKRLKGIVQLDDIPKCSDKLLDSVLLSRVLAALLIDDLVSRTGAFSPWGYGLPASTESVATADGSDDLPDVGGIGLLESAGVAESGGERAVVGALQRHAPQAATTEPAGAVVCQ